jgi:hypothetical protein
MIWRIVLGIIILSSAAEAQRPDTIFVLADSLNWRLTRQVTRFASYVTPNGRRIAERLQTRCELSRLGASLLDESHTHTLFYVPLANSRDLFAGGIALEKTRVFFRGKPPFDRLPSVLEQRDAGLLIRGTQLLHDLYKTDTLRVEVTYSKDGVSGAGGFQRLAIDLTGMQALLPQFFACTAVTPADRPSPSAASRPPVGTVRK